MNEKLVAWSVAVAGCLMLAGCGSSDSLPERDDESTTGGNNPGGGAPATGGANTSGMPAAAGMQASAAGAGTGGASATAGGAGTGAGGQGMSGGSASAGAAGGTGEGGTGGNAVAGAGSHAGGVGGRAGAGGRAEGGGGQGGAGGYAGVAAGGQGAGSGGTAGLGPEATGGRRSGYGRVMFQVNQREEIVRLQTTMLVPLQPRASGTLFLWPGLQPDGENFLPIDNGVLQPVLTWGPSCAPGDQPRAYSTWWISGQYVNTYGNKAGYTGCQGGDIMSVDVGDTLTIDMVLAGTVWTQTITDDQSGEEVAYSIDMLGQAQNIAYFIIEEYSSVPVSEVIFTDTTITFGSPDKADCELTARGQTDYVSAPVASDDGLTCFIADIILRAEGID